MFQGEALLPWRSALDNVMAGLDFAGAAPGRRGGGREWMRRVGLGGFEDRYPHQMSGGMRKRVMLAQTLIRDPDIILMDEPFSALDIQTRQLMENEVLDLWMAKRKAVLFITHDLDEAIAMSDRVVVLSAGPGTHPIGEFAIDLPRPRDVAEVRTHPRFRRAARRDLGRAARGSAQGLCATKEMILGACGASSQAPRAARQSRLRGGPALTAVWL